MVIPNFELIEKLGEGPRTIVYRAVHKAAPNEPLVLKLFKATSFSEHRKPYLRQRVEHLKVLHDPAVITPSTFESKAGVSYVTQPYFDGTTLDVLAKRGLSLRESLTIAAKLALALDKIHEAGIIHGGIKPHNVLVRPGTLDLRVVDFLTPLDVREVSHFIYDPTFIANTLAYTSPEQTGRINHRVSFTSDLYSLGIVLWELMAGRPPFQAKDPLELIHCHLAEEPMDVREVNPAVPPMVAAILGKLTLKQPEKRYQSAAGVYADLARCAAEHTATGTVSTFPLASHDRTHRIVFISKMVGRDQEAATILKDYQEVIGRAFRSIFISGFSGIGKTRLIQELQRPIVQHRGYFASGKFDVYQKNIPYSSLIQAFRTLVRTFLTESDERNQLWKKRISEAIGANGRVLTDVVPELELLIGPQPEVKPLPPVESRNRFLDVFDRFLGCLASETSPLTLFIDDLQWCDVASFEFLTHLFANHEDHPYLLFLGAYRHNEVDAAHPLTKLLHAIKERRQPIKEIRLTALEPTHTHEMISYILDSAPAQTEALAELIHGLTEGNPLFVSESLSYLHNENLLRVDTEQRWQWDLDKIRGSNMPSSVVALFGAKVRRLPAETIALLQFCACMGNTFAPEDLSVIRETSLLHVFETLKPALNQGLLVDAKDKLQFIHDRVQEAVLASIDSEERRKIHSQVGHHLLSALPEGTNLETVDELFAITSHLNLGRDPQLDRAAAYRLSDVNFHAGQRALNALATEAANEYFRISKDLLPEDAWETQYERTFKIFQKSAKTELMCGHAETSEKLLDELLEHAKTDLDKAECLAEQTTSLSSIGNFVKAIETANRGLAYFGRSLPADDAAANARRADMLAKIDAEQADVWSTILHMPFTHDRKSKIELAFYSELIPDLYMSGLVPQLYLSAVQSTQHCLAGGMDESVIYSFSIMGLQLGEQNDFERAFKYEDLARELSARHPNTFGATRGMNGIVWCNMHSRSHPSKIVEYCLQAIHCGKNCGDLYNAGLSYGPLMWNLQVQGKRLAAIEQYAHECLEFSRRFQLSFSVALSQAMQAGWVEPMKVDYHPVPMDEALARWEKDNHVAAAGSYFVHLALAHYYFGEHEAAAQALTRVRAYLTGLTDNVLKRQWYVFQILNAAALHEAAGEGADPEALRAECAPLVAMVERWATLGPLLRPYVAFVHAELARATRRDDARALYLDAIDEANRAEYVLLEGHLCERLGSLLAARGSRACRMMFGEAARLYRACGAERKLETLVERFGEHFEDEGPALAQPTDPSSEYTLPNLDVEYLMKSSLAISAEIEPDSLMHRIMTVVLESSGAQHGYLLIEEAGELLVRAECHIGTGIASRSVNHGIEDAEGLCKPIVRYVYRTRQTVILDNATQAGEFKDHPEVQAMGLRSVLCVPVVKRSRLVGVLYLENRLAEGVFTLDRTRTTELLTSQAAISLENARLVDDMRKAEETVRETRNYLEHLLDDANAPVVVWNAAFEITRFNHAFERVTGTMAVDVMGRPLHVLFPAELRRESVEQVKDSLVGERRAIEILIVRSDGTLRTMLWSSAALHTPDGAVLAYIGQAQDVTVRKQAEERKQFLLQLQAALVRFAEPEGLVRTAISRLVTKLGAAGGRLVVVDPRRREAVVVPGSACGSPPEGGTTFDVGALGDGVAELRRGNVLVGKSDDGRPAVGPDFAQLYKPSPLGAWVIAPLFRDREWAAFVVVDHGAPRVWTDDDVDLVREVAAIVWPLYENARLLKVSEAAVRLRDEFLSVAAHELRTPLTALKLQLEGLARQLSVTTASSMTDALPGITRKVEGANRQTDRFARLIETLLDVTRIGLGKLELHVEEVDLEALVQEALERHELQARAAGCALSLRCADKVVGRWDGARLEQVITNLLSNAIKYGAGSPVEVSVSRHEGAARLTVRDEGIGISQHDRTRIFDRFERAVSSRHYGGLGLGLYVSKQIVEAHGGEIHVETQEGCGSMFAVTLPLVAEISAGGGGRAWRRGQAPHRAS